MKTSTSLLLLAFAGILLFAVVNWTAIMTPVTISLIATDVQAPLGFILLSFTALTTVLFLSYVVYLQTTVMFDARRHTKELAAQRDLADKAEASRFTDLRGHLDAEFRKLADQIEQSGNSTAASIGELEDRLERSSETKGRFN